MELRADVALDLGERLVDAQSRPVGAVARHGVEAVGDDEEVCGKGLVCDGDAVVAAAVVALSVVLDGARLGGRDLEPTQESSGESGRPPDRAPLMRPQLARFPETGPAARALAEAGRTPRPAQRAEVGEGQPDGRAGP